MSTIIAVVLAALAVLDGSFAAFRSSVGRTGLIDHRDSDLQAMRRGAAMAALLLLPVAVLATIDVLRGADRLHAYTRTGEGMVIIYLPYAALVLAALCVYGLLGWRLKYLASAVILGPFTLLRPAVAVLGLVFGAIWSRDTAAILLAGLSVAAVLMIESLADRGWCSESPEPRHSGH